MIWMAWRQFRTAALVTLGVLAVLAVAFALTGPTLAHVYDTTVLNCASHGDCESVRNSFIGRDHLLRDLVLGVILLPALLGAFWGAPLIAREFESGTFRLAWTQGVTRTRWIVTKVSFVGVACVVATGLYSLMVTWWSSPFDSFNDFPYSVFDLRDVVPIGYAAFGFALGVATGVLIRRVVPAMATTLALFVAVRFAFTQYVRPRLMSPLHYSGSFDPFSVAGSGPGGVPGKGQAGDWIISEVTYNTHGQVIGQNGGIGPQGGFNFERSFNGSGKSILQGVGQCPNKFPNPPRGSGSRTHVSNAMQEAVQKCVASFHLRDTLTYQPVSRYWTFQWMELSIYVVLALALVGFSVWWVRRRLS